MSKHSHGTVKPQLQPLRDALVIPNHDTDLSLVKLTRCEIFQEATRPPEKHTVYFFFFLGGDLSPNRGSIDAEFHKYVAAAALMKPLTLFAATEVMYIT